MSYTIKLDNGKYTVVNSNGTLYFLRYDQTWPAADDLRHVGVVLSMAQRIEELETAVKNALFGQPISRSIDRELNGICAYSPAARCPLRLWEKTLRDALEQKERL